MNRIDFMRQLESLLQNISSTEREEALQYYNDYFDDAGADNEQEVIEALGNPARVAENIKKDLFGSIGEGSFQRARASAVADRIIIGGKIAADGYESDHAQIYVAEDFDTDGEGTRLDIGPIATAKMAGMVSGAKTVIWNGLLGKAEDPAYATSSTILAKILGERDDETSIILGGDTSGFVEGLYMEDPSLTYSLISTGGGAALELLAGGEMPGVEVLEGK